MPLEELYFRSMFFFVLIEFWSDKINKIAIINAETSSWQCHLSSSRKTRTKKTENIKFKNTQLWILIQWQVQLKIALDRKISYKSAVVTTLAFSSFFSIKMFFWNLLTNQHNSIYPTNLTQKNNNNIKNKHSQPSKM